MQTKCFFSLLFIFCFFAVPAQNIKLNRALNRISEYERILSLKENFVNDTIALKNYLQPLKSRNSLSDQVLYDLLFANCYSKIFDRINPKSDQLYLQAIHKSQKLKEKELEIWVTLNYAEYLSNNKEISKSLYFFVAAITKIESTNPADIIFPAESNMKIGLFMGTIGDNNEAITYLKKALQYSKTNTAEIAKIADKLGFYYLKTGKLSEAKKNVEYASRTARYIHDDLRYAKTLGNLALIYHQKNDNVTAIKLVLKDIEISEMLNKKQNIMHGYTILTSLHIAENNLEKSKIAVDKADEIAKSDVHFRINELEILKLKLEIIDKGKRLEDELQIRRRIYFLEDSLGKTNGVLPLNQAKWLMQKRNYDRSIASTKKISAELLYTVIILIASGLLIAVILLFIVFKFKKRLFIKQLKNDNQLNEYRNLEFTNEVKLANVNRSLDAQIEFLKEKNITIQSLYYEIEQLRNKDSLAYENNHEKLSEILQSHLMTEENWRIFKSEFSREFPLFYNTLKGNFPELTSSNLRIILLQKLEFSNLEISNLLGITTEAVKKSKQRLKTKLGAKYSELYQLIKVDFKE